MGALTHHPVRDERWGHRLLLRMFVGQKRVRPAIEDSLVAWVLDPATVYPTDPGEISAIGAMTGYLSHIAHGLQVIDVN